jgi:hypothetical protein
MQRLVESLSSITEMSVGIKIKREVHMEAEKKTNTDKMTMKFKAKLILKFKIIVAAVVGCCLMAAPLTRAYKRNCEAAQWSARAVGF